ncbi:amylo-alpha-1,6-glucosidase [Cohnella thailandensis]|uniref:Amylo-alpha-1,6-glucosidase n=1 Tax=Cohnella thailandensis TaxID=557557 RepID=A0A841T2W6_9BACL|nr:amylo-alpha-1,6-glucosidase [Cohnella thailandensis]MBB6637952.1 amylo-alpha-1,6-glucosidase [Cohnella thailandensis]MBP1976909.1 glycogen debranching enzyme [Cohnella thailandensis]
MDYRVIKNNDLFLMTDRHGDVSGEETPNGLYKRDTRFLSRFELAINGKRPVLLSSAANENYIATFRLTNEHMTENGELLLWRESVEVNRERFIYGDVLYENVSLTNYSTKPVSFRLSLRIGADFADMFLVRGFQPADKLGSVLGREASLFGWSSEYRGADGISKAVSVRWDVQAESANEEGEIEFRVELMPAESKRLRLTVSPSIEGEKPVVLEPGQALAELRQAEERWRAKVTDATSDNEVFNRLYERGVQDLQVLLSDFGFGPFPVAGLPWYAVPFGRDSLIAALQMLPLDPSIALGTLRMMAAHQGTQTDGWKDEQPGKIMHELRSGELSKSGQVPFSPYYGSIDSTPLFLLLAAEYVHWTGDSSSIEALMPAIERALDWIGDHGDRDGDGFVEYFQESSKGIANQGWKDSEDSVVHKDGRFAKAPIALIEVQGYVYQAKSRLAPVLEKLGRKEKADKLRAEAAKLKQALDSAFWMEDEAYYAIALDGENEQVRSVTSNPGHLLMSGILSPEKARLVAERLIAPDMFSGYGIRTMSAEATGYNPMSYHDGSVWPHDNSLILLGLSRTGQLEAARTVVGGLLKSAAQFEYARLPELFCGYGDEIGYPVSYPVACSPQAWAAGTSIVILQAMLGLEPNALEGTFKLSPFLPEGIDRLVVRHLPVGEGLLSAEILRGGNGGPVTARVLENTSGLRLEAAEAAPSRSWN